MTAGAIAEDLTGQRFGDWLVLERRGSINNRPQWLCRCTCGKEKRVCGQSLHYGKSSRCASCAQKVRRKAKPSTEDQSTPSKDSQ